MESEPWHRGSIRWMSVLSDVSIYERRTRYAIQCRVDSRRPSDEKRCAASQRSTRPHQLWLRAHLPCSRTVRGWGSARFVRFVDDVASPNLPQRHFAIRRPHFNTEDGSVAIGNRSPRLIIPLADLVHTVIRPIHRAVAAPPPGHPRPCGRCDRAARARPPPAALDAVEGGRQ